MLNRSYFITLQSRHIWRISSHNIKHQNACAYLVSTDFELHVRLQVSLSGGPATMPYVLIHPDPCDSRDKSLLRLYGFWRLSWVDCRSEAANAQRDAHTLFWL